MEGACNAIEEAAASDVLFGLIQGSRPPMPISSSISWESGNYVASSRFGEDKALTAPSIEQRNP